MSRNTLGWTDLEVITPGIAPRRILDRATGYADSGPEGSGLVGILGASGSGKTTLLNALAGRVAPEEGERVLNGKPYTPSTCHNVGYVPQTDRLHSTLTVSETLRFGSALRGNRRSPSRPDEANDAALAELISKLGLESVANTRVGEPGATGRKRGISGGERKRVSIALELLHSPPLLILDEPTSGLDSAATLGVLALLRSLTERQAVVISIHQPSARATSQLGTLGLLSSHGATLFFGPAAQCVEQRAWLLEAAASPRVPPGVPRLKRAVEEHTPWSAGVRAAAMEAA